MTSGSGKRKVLVTGAGGYLGIPLCQRLLDEDCEIIGLDRYFFGLDKLGALREDPRFQIVQADLRQFDLSLLDGVDTVFDLAGLSNDASAEIDPALTTDINFRGASRLSHAAKERGVRRYVYSSSASVYGAGATTGLREGDPLAPQTEYARSKVAAERTLLDLQDSNFEVVLLRNGTLYGLAPRMRFDLVVNIMTMRAWKDRVIYVMGGGEQWRPLVHVTDVVEAMILAASAPAKTVAGEIFNVGSNRDNYRVQQIVQFVVDAVPHVEIHQIPDDPDKRSYNVSFDKISDTLGFEPKRSIPEGIAEIKQALERGTVEPTDPTCFTLQWYKSIIEWSERIERLTYAGSVLSVLDEESSRKK